MKPLSQSLEKLSVRVKELEESATASFEADRAKLEKRRSEIDEDFQKDVSDLQTAAHDAAAKGRTWWDETKASMKRPVDEMRGSIEKRKSEHEIKRAVHDAESAEEDAEAAIELAEYALNLAEYAVIDAVLARMAADDLVDAGGTS